MSLPLTTGLKWLRQHPMVLSATAAAAVAVSVVTYLNSNEDGLERSVSWTDDHGGNLTEVFTEHQDRSEHPTDPLNEEVSTAKESMNTFAPELDADGKPADSPEWGWYVSITPPQEHFGAESVEKQKPITEEDAENSDSDQQT